MDRRAFLQIAGGAAASGLIGGVTPRALALGAGQKLRVARIEYSGPWHVHRGAGATLAEELGYRTSVDVEVDEVPLRLTDPRLSRIPFAILAGDQAFALSDDERAALKRWVELGGFLLVDDSGPEEISQAFQRAVRRELRTLFPLVDLERVSAEHVLYRSFYRIDYPAGRVIRRSTVEGLPIGRRYGVVVLSNDLLGALARDETGQRFLHMPRPGGEGQREMAVRFAVNLAMYALCLHYKDDQVHLDYLLHNRKWKIRKPEP